MSVNQLISQITFYPYLSWTYADFDRYCQFTKETIEMEAKSNQVFEYIKNDKLVCYFQIKELEWDSTYFGFKCGQIKNLLVDSSISLKDIEELIPNIIKDVNNYLKCNKFKFVFTDVNSRCNNSNFLINKLGFNFILNWVDGFISSNQIKDSISNIDNNLEIKIACSNEIEELSEISRNFYYKHGRFYLDTNFEKKKIDELYKSLVYDSFEKKRVILVMKKDNKVIGGFISNDVVKYTAFNNLKVAHLRFLVLHPEYRGFDIGKNLFLSILKYFSDKADIIVTGLETHNIASLNLHSKLGFKFNYVHNAYHLWLR